MNSHAVPFQYAGVREILFMPQSMPSPIDIHLGRRLRRRRRLLGLTQQQLAARVGVRFQQIQKYECGANRLSAARLWALAEALDTPVTYFYDGLGDLPAGMDTDTPSRSLGQAA